MTIDRMLQRCICPTCDSRSKLTNGGCVNDTSDSPNFICGECLDDVHRQQEGTTTPTKKKWLVSETTTEAVIYKIEAETEDEAVAGFGMIPFEDLVEVNRFTTDVFQQGEGEAKQAMDINDIESLIDQSVNSMWDMLKDDVAQRNEGGKKWSDENGLPDWEGMDLRTLAGEVADHIATEVMDRAEHGADFGNGKFDTPKPYEIPTVRIALLPEDIWSASEGESESVGRKPTLNDAALLVEAIEEWIEPYTEGIQLNILVDGNDGDEVQSN